jgi:hypothetical protein
VEEDGDSVIVSGLTADRIVMLPAYDHRQLTREQETDLRTRFTSGDAMSAGVIGAGATGGSDFYDHHLFDDLHFFGHRRVRAATEDDARGHDREMPRELAREVDRTRDERAVNEAEQLRVSEEQLAEGIRRVQAGELGAR